MLQELYVENFALIESLRLPLSKGFNVLSGETGAGKSLLIDAVSLLIGGRAAESFIRKGCDRCLVEGVFCAPYPQELDQLLAEYGHERADEILILTREINRTGKSLCRVNGRTVSLSFLRSLGRLLINIHGQMEHMLLLEEDKQLQLLDSFGGEELLSLKEQVAHSYQKVQQCQKKCREYTEKKQEAAQKIDWLTFQIEEIAKANLMIGEDEHLAQEYARLLNAEKLQEVSSAAYDALCSNASALDKSAEAIRALKEAAELDQQAATLSERLESVYYELEDIAREISTYRQAVEFDPYALEQIEERLNLLRKLKRKYGTDIEEILLYADNAKKELLQWENWDQSGEAAAAELAQAKLDYQQLADQLTNKRKIAAQKLAQAITEEFKLLYMPQAVFDIRFIEREMSPLGQEKALFVIQSNPGELFHPVAKIASGGELSRVVLAIKVILAQLDQVPTLIFDEVDSGLGGVTLTMVAQRMAKIAEYTQVLAITHAALMAAAASHHIYIYKEVNKSRADVNCRILDYQGRVNELARMIAGKNISNFTIEQAKEMLN
ncbi:MAG: DNA repair protein RecN [Bacillota bacterium]|jgi:DNA repair protein RecN (Recombination protein N)